MRRSLPVFPYEQTSAAAVGMSQKCQQETLDSNTSKKRPPTEAALRNRLIRPDLGLVMQNRVQQRLVNIYFAVVIDETQLAKFVHEEADAGSRRPNHFRKRLLTENDWNDGRVSFLPIVRKKQEQASKPLLARIEELIDYVFLNPTIPA